MSDRDILLLADAREAAFSGRGAEIREAARLSQVEVAEAIDVSSVTISRWERGERMPRGEAAKRWIRLLTVLAGRSAPEMREAGFPASEPLANTNVDEHDSA